MQRELTRGEAEGHLLDHAGIAAIVHFNVNRPKKRRCN
jgi:hypothetical protein